MLTQFFRNIGPISADFVFLATIFVIMFLFALYFGKSRMVSLILSFYPAVFFYQNFPYIQKLLILKGDSLIIVNKIVIFLIFFAPINILIGRYIFSEFAGGSKHYFRIAGFSLAGVILFLVFSYRVVSLDLLYNFSPAMDVLFNNADKLFWFSLAPLAILLFL